MKEDWFDDKAVQIGLGMLESTVPSVLIIVMLGTKVNLAWTMFFGAALTIGTLWVLSDEGFRVVELVSYFTTIVVAIVMYLCLMS